VTRAVAVVLVLLISSLGSAKDREMPATIQDVKARHARQLLARPRPETQSALPTQLEGYPVRVEIIGAVRAQ